MFLMFFMCEVNSSYATEIISSQSSHIPEIKYDSNEDNNLFEIFSNNDNNNNTNEFSQEPFVKIRNLNKNYGAVEALKNLNLDLYEGQVYTLLGHNGKIFISFFFCFCFFLFSTRLNINHVNLYGELDDTKPHITFFTQNN
jgi:hypothetical protein